MSPWAVLRFISGELCAVGRAGGKAVWCNGTHQVRLEVHICGRGVVRRETLSTACLDSACTPRHPPRPCASPPLPLSLLLILGKDLQRPHLAQTRIRTQQGLRAATGAAYTYTPTQQKARGGSLPKVSLPPPLSACLASSLAEGALCGDALALSRLGELYSLSLPSCISQGWVSHWRSPRDWVRILPPRGTCSCKRNRNRRSQER